MDELPQKERRERALVADSIKNATSIGFDLHRRLAFEDSSPLSVEVIVSAIEEFKGVVEESVSAGDEVTAHDLHTMLQDALEANSEGTEHWSVASPPPATARSTTRGRAAPSSAASSAPPRAPTAFMVTVPFSDSSESEDHEHSDAVKLTLPDVDIYADPGIWAVLDEGCNSTVHSDAWAENAIQKYRALGFETKFHDRDALVFSGLSGNTTTNGSRSLPFCLLGECGTSVPGTLDSHEISGTAPLLLSQYAQMSLGMVKDTLDQRVCTRNVQWDYARLNDLSGGRRAGGSHLHDAAAPK